MRTEYALGLGILFIVIFGSLFIIGGLDFINNLVYKETRDNFCLSKGYNKSTDYKIGKSDSNWQIECDSRKIFNKVVKFEICDKEDKWGDCKKEKVYFKDFERLKNE